MIDAIFNAYFNTVPYEFFIVVAAATVLTQFLYIFVSRWDIL